MTLRGELQHMKHCTTPGSILSTSRNTKTLTTSLFLFDTNTTVQRLIHKPTSRHPLSTRPDLQGTRA